MEKEENVFDPANRVKRLGGIKDDEAYKRERETKKQEKEKRQVNRQLKFSLWTEAPLCFSRMGGVGIVKCCDCGYEEKVIGCAHGYVRVDDGVYKNGFWLSFQCPNCFAFEVETYYAGKPNEDFKCSHCGTVIREKGTTFYEARDKQLVCPRCHSAQLRYMTLYLT